MKSLRLLTLALLAGLTGCAATTFQNPPLTESGCDVQLVGDWISVPEPESNDTAGEIQLQIGTTCNLSMIEHKKDGDVSGDATMLHVGHYGAQDYFWLDATWAFKRAQSSEPAPAGDFYLVRYDVHGNDLRLLTIDDRAIAHRILDDEIKGEVHKTESTLVNRLTGTVTPAQLREKITFSKNQARFVRQGTEPLK